MIALAGVVSLRGRLFAVEWFVYCLLRVSKMLENSRYSNNFDLDRSQADLVRSCEQYYELVTGKSQGYQIASDNIYNVDARGFLESRLTQTKRIFSRTSKAPTGLQVLVDMASASG
jgi:hypothetical protein